MTASQGMGGKLTAADSWHTVEGQAALAAATHFDELKTFHRAFVLVTSFPLLLHLHLGTFYTSVLLVT